ncbi:MAG TPA: hypothetical protein VI279_09990 [Rhodocyclaceae bacterium]
MKRDIEICGKCFDSGAEVRQQVYPLLPAAINTFSTMHQQNLEPAMCQHHDSSYRVCHAIRPVPQPAAEPAPAKKSWLAAMFAMARRPQAQRA